MGIEKYFEIINAIWTIVVAAVGAFIYKFIPYLKTKIFIKEYYNKKMFFILCEYEMIGMFVGNVGAMVFAVIFGKSTWQSIIFKEQEIAWIIFAVIYLVGIIWIVKRKTEKGKGKYISNIFFGALSYLAISVQFLLIQKNSYSEQYDNIFYIIILMLIFVQGINNIKPEKMRYIIYKVFTDNEEYITTFEPTKRGKFYFIRIIEKNKKEVKRIQLNEDRIHKIEYYIYDLE